MFDKWTIIAVTAIALGVYCLYTFVKIYLKASDKNRQKLIIIYACVITFSIVMYVLVEHSGVGESLGVRTYNKTVPEWQQYGNFEEYLRGTSGNVTFNEN